MNNLDLSYAIQTKGDKVITTSRYLSDVFSKQHFHVMRTIEEQTKKLSNDFHESNFGLVNIIEKNAIGGEVDKSYYELTKDAFTIIAMSFTTAKAMKFKEAYIAAFNKMEKMLLEGQRYQCPHHSQKVIERLLSMAEAFVSYPILEEKAIDMTRFLHKMRKALNYGPTGVMTMYCSRHFGIVPAEVKVTARGKLSFFKQSDLERVVDVLMRQKRMGTFKKPEMGSSLDVYRPAAAKK